MGEQMTASRKRRYRLRCSVALGLVLCLLGGCKCGDKATEKPDTSFCDKQSEWELWDIELQKFAWDDAMVELHALRVGLCSMIYTGQIEPERGIRLFEKAHLAWVERMMGLQMRGESPQQKKSAN